MGMAASQGRLLSITARLSDVEFSSQQKCQSKIKLAMSTEDITTAYTEALNKKKFVGLTGFENGAATYKDLTYDMLTGVNSPLAGDYCLTDSSNRVVVTQEMKKAFEGKTEKQFLESFGASHGTPYKPAVPPSADYKPEIKQSADYKPEVKQSADYKPAVAPSTDYKPEVKQSPDYKAAKPGVYPNGFKFNSECQSHLYDLRRDVNNYNYAINNYEAYKKVNYVIQTLDQLKAAKKIADDKLATFERNYVPGTDQVGYPGSPQVGTPGSPQVGTPGTPQVGTPGIPQVGTAGSPQVGTPGTPEVKAVAALGDPTYYSNLYNRMKEGYATLSDEANTINSKEWLSNQLKNGGLLLEKFGTDGKAKDQDVTSSTEVSEVRDTTNLDIIEAKYKSDLQKIQTKDKKLDMEIKQLDTEHSALQTEVDSVKSVITKNVERAFKTFG